MKNLKITLIITLFCSFLILNNKVSKAQVSAVDSLALVALYNSTDGANWTNNTNWLIADSSVLTWFGITVTDTNVTEINLYFNNLVGTFPAELVNLSSLQQLSLYYNQLTGTIPVEIDNLTSLQILNLSWNQLSGTIPVELGNLSNLNILSLQNNQLTGTIPAELGNLTNLQILRLFNNQISGNIPVELCNLTGLIELNLSNNQLTGTIPIELGNLTNLYCLFLDNNQLIGTISAELGNLTNLNSLILNNNQLTGAIPIGLGNLIDLEYVHIYNNDFIDLPDFSPITFLKDLKIQNNKFTFEDIEPNIGVAIVIFSYSPQDSVLSAFDTIVNIGDSLTLSALVGGANNVYQWYKDGGLIASATNSIYTIDSAALSDEGIYTCEITNTVAVDLTLYRRPVNVLVNPVGISVAYESSIGINIYPNPNKGIITLSNFGKANTYELKIIAPQGRIVYSEIITLGKNDVKQINLHNLSKGIYFLKVQSGKYVEMRKIIVQ